MPTCHKCDRTAATVEMRRLDGGVRWVCKGSSKPGSKCKARQADKRQKGARP